MTASVLPHAADHVSRLWPEYATCWKSLATMSLSSHALARFAWNAASLRASSISLSSSLQRKSSMFASSCARLSPGSCGKQVSRARASRGARWCERGGDGRVDRGIRARARAMSRERMSVTDWWGKRETSDFFATRRHLVVLNEGEHFASASVALRFLSSFALSQRLVSSSIQFNCVLTWWSNSSRSSSSSSSSASTCRIRSAYETSAFAQSAIAATSSNLSSSSPSTS